ncbi:unnamed protein product [Brachionus calyciflorus]|uniref:Uncharacterized protein n=1 Tax=Brachionus calyciflorus TaxID=104777 RepID=A0A813XR82_9BILA|nr:unnamed protein product [Brachionus calyciflorus]
MDFQKRTIKTLAKIKNMLKTEKSVPKKKEKSQNEIPKVLKSNETKRKISLESNLDTNPKQEKIETQIKKPLQNTNILNISNNSEKNNQEIDDESLLKMIKTRLTGLTLLHGNLLKLDKIAEKYNLSKQTLFYDFFGFNQNDQNFPSTEDTLDKSNFISKIESFKNELENTYKSVGDSLKESDSNIKNSECVKTIPRAMIALKLKLPMLFANITSDYLNKFPSQHTDELAKENSSFSCDLIESLYTFRKSLFSNRKDLNKLKDLIEEIQNSDFGINKSIVSIKEEISEENNEPVMSNESEKNEPTVSNNV